jgi:hypothetical protein
MAATDGLLTLCQAAAVFESAQRETGKLAGYLRRFRPRRARAKKAAPRSLVGRTVWKEFHDGRGRPRVFQGRVASVCCAARGRPFAFGAGVTARVKFAVQYDDGDAEDMTHAELVGLIVD